ncbi:MAG: TRAP transporter substrate-binding protein DctP [Pseudomonadales bacterium]
MNIFRLLLLIGVVFTTYLAYGTTIFKIATISPDGSSWMNLLREGGRSVELATEGRAKFKFYPGGVKGDDQTVLKLMRVGQLHGGVVMTGVFNRIYPDVQIYNMPMHFRTPQEIDFVRATLDPVLMRGLEHAGFVCFGIAEVGMAYAMGKKRATSIAGARRLKVWTPQGDEAAMRTLAAFGITPIPSSIANVLPGLQTGLFDTITSPPVAAVALQWHTQLRYVLDLPLMYVYGLFVVSASQFERLNAADQTAVRSIMADVVRRADRKNRADDVATFDVLLAQGIERLTPSDDERREWQLVAEQAAEEWIDRGIVSRGLYQRFRLALEAQR